MSGTVRWLAGAALLAAAPLWAQLPGGGLGGLMGRNGPSSALLLAGAEAVRKELNLTTEQTGKVNALINEVQGKVVAGGVGGLGQFAQLAQLPPQERAKKIAEMRDKAAADGQQLAGEYLPKVMAILTPEQKARLQQIGWQAAGAAALQDPELAKQLNLAPDQLAKMAALGKQTEEKLAAARQEFQGNFQQAAPKLREIVQARDQALLDVLTPEQAEQFSKLKGKEFDLSQLRGGLGGGPFRRPNP